MAEMSGGGAAYDEPRIRAVLGTLAQSQRVAFACSMAERLMPMYEFFCHSTGQGDAQALRDVLDEAWALATFEERSSEIVDAKRAVAESLVPHDDDHDWTSLSPIAQNAAASVAYVLRTWLTSDPQDAVWAARQLYEAADYLVQLQAAEQTYTDTDSQEPVMMAVAAISSVLSSVASAVSTAELQRDASAHGAIFRRLLEDSD